MKFSQVRLLVDDFPACFRFLQDSLGLECTFGGEDDGYASFKAGTGTLAVFRRDEQAEVIELRAAGDGALTVLEVDDVDAEAERLATRSSAAPSARRRGEGASRTSATRTGTCSSSSRRSRPKSDPAAPSARRRSPESTCSCAPT